ncbi:MAG: SacI homology domain-containing protein, partial [Olpidium bornovanus]
GLTNSGQGGKAEEEGGGGEDNRLTRRFWRFLRFAYSSTRNRSTNGQSAKSPWSCLRTLSTLRTITVRPGAPTRECFREARAHLRSSSSPRADITNSLQRKMAPANRGAADSEAAAPCDRRPLWQRADRRFFWNAKIAYESPVGCDSKVQLHSWALPVMQGHIAVDACEFDGRILNFAIISRRSKERAGLRYMRRGIDDEGRVANFVETEQIVFLEVNFASGPNSRSFWVSARSVASGPSGPTSLKPVPRLEHTEKENQDALNLHFQKLLSLYADVIVVDLVDQSGKETIVASAYRKALQAFGKIRVIGPAFYARGTLTAGRRRAFGRDHAFDFHHECKGMKYENIMRLVAALEPDLVEK